MRRFYFLIMVLTVFLIPNVYAQSSAGPSGPEGKTGSTVSPESKTAGEKVSSGAEVIPEEKSYSDAEKVPRVKPSSDAQRDPGAQTSGEKFTISSVPSNDDGGGCLVATAAYGTELAPQVQLLREIRDRTLLGTNSGSAFMASFNAIYYSFSPTVADLERQSPIFKDVVKVAMTPMLSTLSILNHVNVDSEPEMLGYGIGIILLNIGMYFVLPAFVILKLKGRHKKNQFHL